jgi:putative copper export protein
VRALSFCVAIQAAGAPLFLSIVGGELSRVRESVLVLGNRSAWAGVVLVVLYQASEPIRLLGDVRGVLDSSLQGALLESPLGTATAVRLLGLLLIAVGCRTWHRHGSTVPVVGSALVVASFAFMGHTAEGDQRWLTATALLIHVVVIAFWFGSLLPLYQASRQLSLSATGELIERFSYVAVRIVPAIFVAGLALAVALLPSIASLGTRYGLLLLTKVVGFAVLMAAAAFNKIKLGPRVRSGDSHALVTLRKVVLVEWVLIAGVIATTSTMTGLFSPEH